MSPMAAWLGRVADDLAINPFLARHAGRGAA
jgi:hypothetical protein